MLRWFFEDLQQGLSGYSCGLWIENAWLTFVGNAPARYLFCSLLAVLTRRSTPTTTHITRKHAETVRSFPPTCCCMDP